MDGNQLQLDIDECDLILKALDALAEKGGSDLLIQTSLLAILAPDKDSMDKMINKSKERFDERKPQMELLKENIYLFRAKIIQLRRQLDKTDMVNIMKEDLLGQIDKGIRKGLDDNG